MGFSSLHAIVRTNENRLRAAYHRTLTDEVFNAVKVLGVLGTGHNDHVDFEMDPGPDVGLILRSELGRPDRHSRHVHHSPGSQELSALYHTKHLVAVYKVTGYVSKPPRVYHGCGMFRRVGGMRVGADRRYALYP